MRERSPLFRAQAIRAPLLILQGDNDPRVPLAESRQIAAAVRRRGGIADLIVYPGEGHGFHKLEDRLDGMTVGERLLPVAWGGDGGQELGSELFNGIVDLLSGSPG